MNRLYVDMIYETCNTFDMFKGFIKPSELYFLILLLLFIARPFHLVFAEDQIAPDVVPPPPTDTVDSVLPVENINPESNPPLEENLELTDPEENDIAPQNQSSSNESSEESNYKRKDIKSSSNKPLTTDPTSGALLYSYNFKIPPGRNNLTPKIELSYNSQNANLSGTFGSGWNLAIPYIERLNKEGSNNLYSKDFYVSSLSGELLKQSSTSYIPKVESGEFLTHVYQNDVWTVTDKSGTVYTFGNSAQARQDDPSDSTRIYKWMLEEVRDTNGNFIKYEYSKDSGQIYPDNIKYTGYNTTDGIFTINFVKETRNDISISYTTGFKVHSKYRIKEIQALVNNVWAKKYFLAFTNADSGGGSLLESITESGQADSVVTTLPKVTFEYTKSTPGWTHDSSWQIPLPFYEEFGMRMADINGDGLIDIACTNMMTNVRCDKHNPEFYLNTGSGWKNVSSSWKFPKRPDGSGDVESFTDYNGGDLYLKLIDVNGDNLADLVKATDSSKYIYLNNGSGWTYDSSWQIPLPFNEELGMRMADINGDGLIDIACHNEATNGRCNKKNPEVYLNTGSGWQNVSSSWTWPVKAYTYDNSTESFTSSNGNYVSLELVDVNGDHLTDLVKGYDTSTKYVYLNNGSGWTYDSSLSFAIPFTESSSDYGMRMGELNGDGLIDIACRNMLTNVNCDKANHQFYINTGYGWKNVSSSWKFPKRPDGSGEVEAFANSRRMDLYLRLIDVNGDNLSDLVKATNDFKYIYMNNTKVSSNLLNKITYSTGGSANISYKASAILKDNSGNLLNPKLSLSIDTVDKMINNDGVGNSSTTLYSYESGSYYFNTPLDRKFAGFGKVIKTNPDNTKEISYYNQGNDTDSTNGEYADHVAKIGRVYREDVLDANDNLVKQTTTKWEKSQLGSLDAYFVYPTQTISRIFNSTDSFDTAESYSYDTSNGNLLNKVEYGSVTASDYQTFSDTGNDKRNTEYTYATCGSCANMQLPSSVITKDNSGNKVAETKLYYDNQSFGVATLGNNTKEEKLVSVSHYATALKSYNAYGLISSSTDGNSNTTNYTYDSYNMYPATTTNALSQATNYLYDYNSGQVKRTVDPNGSIAEVDYDGLGRPISERTSSDTSYTTLITKATYNYQDTMSGSSLRYIQKATYYSPTLFGISYTLLDGLDRTIRNITQTDTTNFIATDTVYDNMGRVAKKSLPYVVGGIVTDYFGPTSNLDLLTTLSYDALGRLSTSTNTLGTISNVYDLNKTTNTDQENHTKDIVTDAFGNIESVIEHNGASTYTTNYSWDVLGNLIGITDALGNVREFTYDALGNRLSATDLHSTGDNDYGFYTYQYDQNNNLRQKNTPKGDMVVYTYDALNRPLTESNNSTNQISYTYDSCAKGVGKLCNVSRLGSTNKSFGYTNRGLISSDVTNWGANIWNTGTTYDYQGNPMQITYPDTSKVRYTRDVRGLITKVERQEPASAWLNVINSVIYNPLGQKLVVTYGNNRMQTYDYDATNQYRLLSNKVDAPAGSMFTNLMDTNYQWSPSGNLTNKIENFDPSNPQQFTYSYDDLSRLTEARKTLTSGMPGYIENYSYNPIGNILSKTGVGNYTYDGTTPGDYANPHAVLNAGLNSYTYDPNGNMVQITDSTSTTNLNYSYRNELTQYNRSVTNPVNMEMWYDYNGDRVKTVDSSGTTYNPNNYYEDNGTKKTKYIFLDNQLVGTVVKSGTSNPTIQYIHPDHLGGTQLVTDMTGAKVQELEYYPFGEVLSNIKSGSFDEVHKYTGHDFDKDTELNYMQARYQSGKEGRFYQQDPVFINLDKDRLAQYLIDPQLQNSYSYGRNNPVKYVDPDGEFAENITNLIAISLLYGPSIRNSYINSPQAFAKSITQKTNNPRNYPNGAFLRSNKVHVTFSPGADNKVNKKLANYFKEIMDKAYLEGINSVNISSTTNHTSNKGKSAHEIGNGARALDINYINQEHVSPVDSYSEKLQNVIRNTVGYNANYGPKIIEKISNGKPINAPEARTSAPDGHYRHVHISVPK